MPWLVCGCCLFLVGFVPCWFLSSGEIWFQSHANSSCWPTMSRTCPAMQEKKKKDPVLELPPPPCAVLPVFSTHVWLSAIENFWISKVVWAAPGIALLSSPGWASLWRLFALFYAVFASPSQDKLSGIWGGCSFSFHTFHLWDWNCSRVFLALLIWHKLGFLMKTSFNGHQPLQFVQTFALSCL